MDSDGKNTMYTINKMSSILKSKEHFFDTFEEVGEGTVPYRCTDYASNRIFMKM